MRSEPIHGQKTSVPQLLMDALLSASGSATPLAIAQKAIDDLLAVYGDANQQIDALPTVEKELILVLQSTSDGRFDLANELIDLIDARLRTIRISQKGMKQAAAIRPRDENMLEMERLNLRAVA